MRHLHAEFTLAVVMSHTNLSLVCDAVLHQGELTARVFVELPVLLPVCAHNATSADRFQ